MEMYPGPEQRTTETYTIPGIGPNPHLPYVPQLEEVDYMGTEVVPEYINDQGLYYPAANYYGYYCTGFESPSEWDDHSRVFGVDGQDLHYSGVQTESLPYVYYTPSYGFAQSPYNPYNPYIPGAVMGLDGSYLGTQQYAPDPSYQTPVSSPAYIPIVVQPSTDVAPNSTQGPSLFNTGVSMASRPINTGAKYTSPLALTNVAANTQRSALGNPTPETSQSSQTTAKSSEGILVNDPSNKQSLSQGAIEVGNATHATQVRNSSSVQAPNHFSNGRVPTIQNPLKVVASSNDSFPQFGTNIRGWSTADKFRPRLQFHGDLNNPGRAIDVLGEQNKGPRTSRSKSQWTPASVDGVNPTKSATSNTQQIIINADQFNRDDFPVNYSDAKFFVIKSYSEDDVHKSIKYKVWSSTANGNKRLDSAYQEAQRIILGQPRNCHIFLFFSVNASGQFCGVAEMIGPVNFDKDMDFWQQDKWTGSFPVKWHIIKDVPNTSFRHIILENNENKPVTNSRDTQEIPYLPGLNMLNIFKGTPLKTSILDDFIFYEERERIMQEDKARVLGRSASQFLSAVFPVDKSDGMVFHPSKADEKQSNDAMSEPLKANERHVSATEGQPPKADGKPPNGVINRSLSSTGKQHNGAVHQHSKTDGKLPNVVICSPTKADEKGPSHAVGHSEQANWKPSNDSINRPPSKSNDSTNTDLQPPKADRNSIKLKDSENVADRPSKANEKNSNLAVNQPAKADGKPSNVSVKWPTTDLPPPKADRNSSKVKDPKNTITQPAKMDRKDMKSTGDHRLKPNRKDSKVMGDQPLKLNSNSSGDQHSKAERNPSKPKQQDTQKLDSIKLSNDEVATQEPAINFRETSSTLNVGSLVVDSREGAASNSRAMNTENSSIAVVTVGSVPIRVEGLGESSSSVITVGTISIDPKNLKPNKHGAFSGGRPHQKYQK